MTLGGLLVWPGSVTRRWPHRQPTDVPGARGCLAQSFAFTAVGMFADGRAETSPGFGGDLFLRTRAS